MEDIGSIEGIESYRGQGYEVAKAGKCLWDFPGPPSLRDGCDLRGACRAYLMSLCGIPLLMGCLQVR